MKTWKPREKMGQLTIDHLNHNKRDNTLKNLEWVTRGENQKRAIEDYFIISKNGEAKPVSSLRSKPKIKINDKIYTPNEAAKLIYQTHSGVNFKKALRKVNLTATDGLPRSFYGVKFEAVMI